MPVFQLTQKKTHKSSVPGRHPYGVRALIVMLGFLILIGIRQADAQLLYGSVVGTVTDNQGAVVPEAVVNVKQTETGETRSAVTNDSGAYPVSTISAGVYDVSVSKPGFQLFQAKAIAVLINTTVRVDASLTVGAATQTITVSSEAAQLQTDRPDVHGEVTSDGSSSSCRRRQEPTRGW